MRQACRVVHTAEQTLPARKLLYMIKFLSEIFIYRANGTNLGSHMDVSMYALIIELNSVEPPLLYLGGADVLPSPKVKPIRSNIYCKNRDHA